MQCEIIEKRRVVEIQIKEGCVARDQSRVGADASYGNRTAVLEERVVGFYEEDVKKSIQS
jgi:hypothetical protein